MTMENLGYLFFIHALPLKSVLTRNEFAKKLLSTLCKNDPKWRSTFGTAQFSSSLEASHMIKSSPNTVNTRIFCKNKKVKPIITVRIQCQNVFVSEKNIFQLYFHDFVTIFRLKTQNLHVHYSNNIQSRRTKYCVSTVMLKKMCG